MGGISFCRLTRDEFAFCNVLFFCDAVIDAGENEVRFIRFNFLRVESRIVRLKILHEINAPHHSFTNYFLQLINYNEIMVKDGIFSSLPIGSKYFNRNVTSHSFYIESANQSVFFFLSKRFKAAACFTYVPSRFWHAFPRIIRRQRNDILGYGGGVRLYAHHIPRQAAAV